MHPSKESLRPKIVVVRGKRVVLDAELARVYGVTTKRLNQAVRRNKSRFPEDFAFRLTDAESTYLRSQFVTSSLLDISEQEVAANPPDSPSPTYGGPRYRPWVFAEHGALMAANVLRSPRAVRMSVHVVRAFVAMRERLAVDAEILKRLAEIDKTLLGHDVALRELWRQIEPLLAPPQEPPQRRIGFDVRDESPPAT